MFKAIALGSHAIELNGQPVVEGFLEDGDLLTFGEYEVRISISGLTCDLDISTSATTGSQELFASKIDQNLSMQTMFRAALDLSALEPEEAPEAEVDRASLVWVPPLDVKKSLFPTIVVFLCIVVTLAVVAVFNWPVGRGFLNRPLSDAHSSDGFVEAAETHLGMAADCSSCHEGFAGVASARCVACHEAEKEHTVHVGVRISQRARTWGSDRPFASVARSPICTMWKPAGSSRMAECGWLTDGRGWPPCRLVTQTASPGRGGSMGRSSSVEGAGPYEA